MWLLPFRVAISTRTRTLPPPSNWCGTPPTPKHTPRTACEAETPNSGCGGGAPCTPPAFPPTAPKPPFLQKTLGLLWGNFFPTHTRAGAPPTRSPYGIWGPSPTPRNFTNGLRGRDSQSGCGVGLRQNFAPTDNQRTSPSTPTPNFEKTYSNHFPPNAVPKTTAINQLRILSCFLEHVRE